MDYTPPLGSIDPNAPYSDGNIALGLKGSRPPAKSWNDIYAELLNVIDVAGLTRDGDDLTQLAAAIQMLANFNIASLSEEAAIEMGDFLPFFDVDSGDERKLTASSLLSRFMGGRMVIAADANWNTLVTPGMYNTTGSAYINAPLGASAHPGTLWIIGRSQSANHATQLFFYSAANPAIWTRTTTDAGATWSAWKKISFAVFDDYVESSQLTIVNGSTLTFAHGFGAMPRLAKAEMVCVNAIHGFSVGQRIQFNSDNGTTNNAGCTLFMDATNVYLRVPSSGMQYVRLDATSTVAIPIDNANWRIVLSAFKGV